MSNTSEHDTPRVVRAIFEHEDKPGERIVDHRGNPPWAFVELGGVETPEDTFRRLGREVLGHTPDIEGRAPEHESGRETHFAFRAKPVTPPVKPLPDSPYQWRPVIR